MYQDDKLIMKKGKWILYIQEIIMKEVGLYLQGNTIRKINIQRYYRPNPWFLGLNKQDELVNQFVEREVVQENETTSISVLETGNVPITFQDNSKTDE